MLQQNSDCLEKSPRKNENIQLFGNAIEPVMEENGPWVGEKRKNCTTWIVFSPGFVFFTPPPIYRGVD